MFENIGKENFFQKLKSTNCGFKHNWQSVRILLFLCREYSGGNMFAEGIEDRASVKDVLKGILCHSSLCKADGNDFSKKKLSFYEMSMNSKEEFLLSEDWNFETRSNELAGKIVNLADEIAQRHHDIEDAITFHYLQPESAIEVIWGSSDGDTPESFKKKQEMVSKCGDNEDLFLKKVSSIIVDYLVRNLVDEYIDDGNYRLSFNADGEKVNRGMQDRMSNVVLHSRSVQRMDSRGKFIIRKLFEAYATNPLQMPNNTLNAVFREYLRQQLWEIKGIASMNAGIKEKIRKVLEREDGLNIFKYAHECRNMFDKCNGQDKIELGIMPDYYLMDDNRVMDKIVIDKGWFRICLMRVIADYISGMTDLYAETEYRKLYGMIHDIIA